MKKIGFLILLLGFFSIGSFANGYAQSQEPPGRKLAGLKIAYVTNQLSLTPEEAEKFWPVYNNYIREFRKTRMEKKEDVLVQEEEMLNLRKKYRAEFKKILGTDARANRSLTLERDFNNIIRKELQKRREMKGEKQKKDNPY
jgi:hypothetical protein